jgi:hypothetical protein
MINATAACRVVHTPRAWRGYCNLFCVLLDPQARVMCLDASHILLICGCEYLMDAKSSMPQEGPGHT